MTRLRATLVAIAIAVCLPAGAVRAAEQCFKFPVRGGPEEVCATGSFRNGPILAPPGLVTLKTFEFEFTNRTERGMHSTVEANGEALEPDVQVLAAFTLSPGGDGLTDDEETVGYDADGDGVIDVRSAGDTALPPSRSSPTRSPLASRNPPVSTHRLMPGRPSGFGAWRPVSSPPAPGPT